MKIFNNSEKGEPADRTINVGLPEDLKGNLEEMAPVSLSQANGIADFFGQNICILIIDDNMSFRNILKTILETKGAIVEFANDGKLGLRKYLDSPEKYSAILTDIHMPVMDGYQVAEQIRQTSNDTVSSIPIIAISGEVQLEEKYEKLFTHYFQKPFDLDRFTAVLANLIRKL